MNSGSMGEGLLPAWVGWICFAIYIVILLIHLYHLVTMKGLHRAWHIGHVLMALGMAWMFLPTPPSGIPALAWQIAYAVAAFLILAWCIWNWSYRQAVNFPWITLFIGMLAMIYMFTFPGAATQYLTYILVAYFVLESVAWFVGAFDETEQGQRRLLPLAIGPRADSVHALVEAGSLTIRLTLGFMTLGMGFMLFVMELPR